VYARKGQFEDDESPAVRILFDSDEIKEENPVSSNENDKKGDNNKFEEKSE